MLRVMTLNVLFGGEDRFSRLLDIIRDARPDLLVLQECLGWEDGERLGEVAGVLGISAAEPFSHLALARPRRSGRRFHIAVFSRSPLSMRRVHADPCFIGHCIAECVLAYENAPLVLFGAHLDPHHEKYRFVEARYVGAQIDPLDFARGYYLLAGDLNALSLRDPYPPDLAEKVEQAGTEKYGHPPRFEVIKELERFGWVDTLWHKGAPSHWVTAPRDRGGVHIDYRTDYIFASPKLAERLVSTEVLDVQGASDHHGVLASFR